MPYFQTSVADCGTITYEMTLTSTGYDPITPGYASMSGNKMTFTDLSLYDVGLIEVRVDVKTDIASTTAAYQIFTQISVCKAASITALYTINANTDPSPIDNPYTNFLSAGNDAGTCNVDGDGSNDIWKVKGPATSDVEVLISDSSVNSWLSTLAYDLRVTIADPNSVTFDGLYSIYHEEGHASEQNELLICYIRKPSGSEFVSGTDLYVITKADYSSNILEIELNDYILTPEAGCGNLVYTESWVSGYDPINASQASMTGKKLTLSSLSSYSAGLITLKVEISTDLTSSPAHSINIRITVCEPVPSNLAT